MQAASLALFLVGGLLLLLGLFGGGAGAQGPGGGGAFVVASAYALLGWWVRYRRSLLALVVGMVFLAGNAGLMIHQALSSGGSFPLALTLAHVLLLVPMARAIPRHPQARPPHPRGRGRGDAPLKVAVLSTSAGSPSECCATKLSTISWLTGAIRCRRAIPPEGGEPVLGREAVCRRGSGSPDPAAATATSAAA